MAAPPIFTSTPLFQVYSPFLVKIFVLPTSDSIFGRSSPPPSPLIRGGRGGVPTMTLEWNHGFRGKHSFNFFLWLKFRVISHSKRNSFQWFASLIIPIFWRKLDFFHLSFNKIISVSPDQKPWLHFLKMFKEIRFLEQILLTLSAWLKTIERLM